MPRKLSDFYRQVVCHRPGFVVAPCYAISRAGAVFSCHSGEWKPLKVYDGRKRFNQPLRYVRLMTDTPTGRHPVAHCIRRLLMAAFHGPRPGPGWVVMRRDTTKHWRDSLHADNLFWGRQGQRLARYQAERQVLDDATVKAWRAELRADGWDVPKLRGWAEAVGVTFDCVAQACCGIRFRHLNELHPPAKRPPRPPLVRWAGKLTAGDRAAIRRRLKRGEKPAVVHRDYPQVKRATIYHLKRH